jgi:tRNA G18 (ribose-2'-O)-methylase SpoU
MPLVHVTAFDDRRLDHYRSLKLPWTSRRLGVFIVEGEKLVRRLLSSGLQVHSVLAGEHFLAHAALELPDDVMTIVVPDRLLQEIVGFKFHRGVLACGLRATGRGKSPDLENVLSRVGIDETKSGVHEHDKISGGTGYSSALLGRESTSGTGEASGTRPEDNGVTEDKGGGRHTIVVCVDIHDPTNLGTILRTAEAFGVAAVVLGGNCADPWSRRVLRVSMGSPLQLPLVCSDKLGDDLVRLRRRFHMTLLAAVAGGAAEPLERCTHPGRLAILLGNESDGLRDEWIRLCDACVTIPMQPRADSLNVAVATGILLHHFCSPRTLNERPPCG